MRGSITCQIITKSLGEGPSEFIVVSTNINDVPKLTQGGAMHIAGAVVCAALGRRCGVKVTQTHTVCNFDSDTNVNYCIAVCVRR